MAARRDRLAKRRKTVGYTQETLAEKLGVDPTTVRRWETGETETGPHPWMRPKLARCLQVSVEELEELFREASITDDPSVDSYKRRSDIGITDLTATSPVDLRPTDGPDSLASQNSHGLVLPTGQQVLGSLVSAVSAELPGSLAGPLLYLAFLSTAAQTAPSIEQRAQLREQLQTFLHEWANTVERREHLRMLGSLAAAVAASPLLNLDRDEQERLSKVVAQPSRVDEQSIDHIEALFRDCKRQEDRFGPHSVLGTVIDQREFVDSLLAECSDELRPRLLSVYSNMSSSIGGYFFNLDDIASAMHYLDQAREAAQEARNTELAVYTLCLMTYFSSWQGKTHAAVDFAAAAQSLGTQTDDRLLQAYTAVESSMAYAADGQYKECMTEFDRALAALALQPANGLPESPTYWFHEGLVASCRSDCLLRFGKPAEAIAAAERGLQLYSSSSVRGVALCNFRLGTARLLSGEVEEAARVISEGALLAAKNRTARLTSEVRAARRRLQPWQDTPTVRELDERLRVYGMGGR